MPQGVILQVYRLAVARNPEIADVAGRLVERPSGRVLQAVAAIDRANNREFFAVGRPCRQGDALGHCAWRAPAYRRTLQFSRGVEHSHLARAGDIEEFRIDAKIATLRISRLNGIDVILPSVFGGIVDHRLAIGSESCIRNNFAPESQGLEGWRVGVRASQEEERYGRARSGQRCEGHDSMPPGTGLRWLRSLLTTHAGFRQVLASMLQLAVEIFGGLVALGRILCEAPLDLPSQRGRNRSRQGFRLIANDGRHRLGRAGANKRALAPRPLVEDQAETKL